MTDHEEFPQGWHTTVTAGSSFDNKDHYARQVFVDLLVYMEQSAIAAKWDFKQAWNGGNNLTTRKSIINTLLCPASSDARYTTVASTMAASSDYTYAVSEGSQFRTAAGVTASGNRHPQNMGFFRYGPPASGGKTYQPEVLKPDGCSDGLAQTFMFFEDAGLPMFWDRGKPDPGFSGVTNGWWADPSASIVMGEVLCPSAINCNNGNEIYSFHELGCNFAFADGSVQFLRHDVKPKILHALWTSAGGERISEADWN